MGEKQRVLQGTAENCCKVSAPVQKGTVRNQQGAMITAMITAFTAITAKLRYLRHTTYTGIASTLGNGKGSGKTHGTQASSQASSQASLTQARPRNAEATQARHRNAEATQASASPWRSQRATVLLSVLIILAIGMTIVVAMTASTSQVFKSVSTLQHQYQSSIYSRTIINALSAAFALDTNGYDSADDLWTTLPPLPAEDSSIISATILPLNSRISLNDIFSTDENLKQRVRSSIEQLVFDMDGDVNFIPELYLWGEGKGADKPLYTNQKTYSNTGKPFSTLAELRLLPSITPELYDKISENFNVGTKGSQLNVNFASQETLELLLPDLSNYIQQWIEYRDKSGGISGISQFREILNIPPDIYTENIRYLSVNSNSFYVKLVISRGGSVANYHMLINREVNSRSISLRRYIEGNNEHYF